MREVAVTAPPVPAEWSRAWGQPAYRIVADGCAEGVTAPGELIIITMRAGRTVPILAYPSWHSPGAPSEELLPAGSVWPHFAPESPAATLELRFADAPIALLVDSIRRAGGSPAMINLDRMRAEVAARSYEDPWAIDWSRVREALTSDQMRTNYLDPCRDSYPIELPAGVWLSANPFAAPLAGGEVELSAGYHRLYGLTGTRLRVQSGPTPIVLGPLP